MCRISVITVCFNAVTLIEETIKSVLGFQSDSIDFIIIDGGSKDGTVDVINRYSKKLKYWISEPDGGIYDAMNKGWMHADADSFIIYLGAGDTLIDLPDINELSLANIYYGDVLMGNGRTFVGKKDFRLRFGNTLHHQSLLIPKILHVDPPFNIKYKVFADFDFNQRLLKGSYKYVKLKNLKSYFAPDGVSEHDKTFEWFFIIRSNFGLAHAIIGFGYFYFHELRKIMGR